MGARKKYAPRLKSGEMVDRAQFRGAARKVVGKAYDGKKWGHVAVHVMFDVFCVS